MGAAPRTDWAVAPLDRYGAAAALGISTRTLTDAVKRWPYYERRGRKQVFYPEHIDQLREAFQCQTSGSTSATEYGKSLEPSPVTAFDKALAAVTKAKQKSCGPTSKPGSGSVIPMARKPSEPSRKP